VSPRFRAVELGDEIREVIDHTGLLVEPGRGVDYTEDPRPRGDAIKVADGAFETAENGWGREAGRDVALM
jgi:hypothetical protein